MRSGKRRSRESPLSHSEGVSVAGAEVLAGGLPQTASQHQIYSYSWKPLFGDTYLPDVDREGAQILLAGPAVSCHTHAALLWAPLIYVLLALHPYCRVWWAR